MKSDKVSRDEIGVWMGTWQAGVTASTKSHKQNEAITTKEKISILKTKMPAPSLKCN